MAVCMARVSVAALLLRIVGFIASHRWVLYFCIASTFVVASVFTVVTFPQCSPISVLWDPTPPVHAGILLFGGILRYPRPVISGFMLIEWSRLTYTRLERCRRRLSRSASYHNLCETANGQEQKDGVVQSHG